MNIPPTQTSFSYSNSNDFSIKYYCKWAIKHIFILRWLHRKYNTFIESDYFFGGQVTGHCPATTRTHTIRHGSLDSCNG